MAASPRIIVIDAGIIGASIAWHLARAGASVTVIEAGQAGGVATRNSWAWINASFGNTERYFRLRIRAMEEWRRLERDLPGLRVAWAGGLIWDLPVEALQAFAAEHAAWGYDIRQVDRAGIQRLEPELAAPPELALHAADEGAVEPLAATLTFFRPRKGWARS
jgi:glycine/D-amino acid oxidase-like deaminating enzyme